MKTTCAMLLAIILGVALGSGIAVLKMKSPPFNQKTSKKKAVEKAPPIPKPDEPAPKVVVDQTDFDFGTLDMSVKGSHDFTFTNVGKAPLSLTDGGTSCRCTMSKLDNKEIPPGESTKVTITWKPTENPGPYKQTAKINTNDPARPQIALTVFGKITTAIRFYPTELIFSRLSTNDSADAQANLFYYLDEPLKITGRKWEDESTAKFFQADIKPLPAEELKAEPSAKSGMSVRVTVKPGLPQGPVQQKLVIDTNLKSSPQLVLPIQGIVGSEIAVVGRGWDPDKGVLNLGVVPRADGGRWRLLLVIRGPLRKQVKFTAVNAEPNELQATLGEPAEINQGAVIQVPLTINIPKDSPPGSHLGSEQGRLGVIILETTHPNVPKIRIFVRFIVEG